LIPGPIFIFPVPNLGTSYPVPIIGTMLKTIGTQKYAHLIAWLKKSRSAQGLTMRELAERLDEPHSFVQKTELLERKLDVYEFVRYCEALEVSPEDGIQTLRSS